MRTTVKRGLIRPIGLRGPRRDVKFALRVLARKPAFTAMAVSTLALGIGAATTIFTMLDGVLLTPLAFENAEQLATVWQTNATYRSQPTLSARWNKLWFSYPEYLQWRDAQRSFREVAIFGSQEMALTSPGEPSEVVVHTATPTLLTVVGSRPLIGRWFTGSEQGPGADRVAVISYSMWVSRYGQDSSVINQYITLNDHRFRIVGVMPNGFELPNLTSSGGAHPSLWIPVGAHGGGQKLDSSYEGIARLRPGVTVQQAASESNPIIAAITGSTDRGVNIVPRLNAETGSARAPLLLLTAGAALLLLIACVNIAVLLLGEVPAREKEFVTRVALGASRSRLIGQLLTEGVVLAALANVVGVALSFIGVRLLVALAPPGMPRLENVQVSMRVLAFSIVLTSVIGVGFALAPALSAIPTQLGAALQRSSRQISRSRRRMQSTAILAQTTMALVLLSGAVALGRSLQQLGAVRLGFTADHVLTLSMSPSTAKYPTPAALIAFHDELRQRLEALPVIERAGVVSNLPLAGRNGTMSIELGDVSYDAGTPRPSVQRRAIGAGYFEAMRIPLLGGRRFSTTTNPDEIIVDEAFAERFWPGESPLQRRITVYKKQFTIVGVVGSVTHTRIDDAAQATIYFPFSQMATRDVFVVLRTSTDPVSVLSAVRSAIREIDPALPLPRVLTMTEYVTRSLAADRYRALLLGFFGIAAALLTAVGVFGVTVRSVSQQRTEIGVRMALGAGRSSVVGLVLRHQIASIVGGLVVGAVVVRLGAPQLQQFVYRINPSDWRYVLATAVILMVVTVIGLLAPVRVALGVQPAHLIRTDS